jgi:hypothetical protein
VCFELEGGGVGPARGRLSRAPTANNFLFSEKRRPQNANPHSKIFYFIFSKNLLQHQMLQRVLSASPRKASPSYLVLRRCNAIKLFLSHPDNSTGFTV